MNTTFSTGMATGADGSAAGQAAASDALADLAAGRVDFCQVFSSAAYDHRTVVAGVRSVVDDGTLIVGCSAAGEFTETRTRSGSVALALVSSDTVSFSAGIGTGLGADVAGAVRDAVRGLPTVVPDKPHQSAIVLHDGLSGVGEELTAHARRELGDDVLLVGGSAGDDLEMDETVVSVDDTVANDAVAIALVAAERPMAAGRHHGHEPISRPREVTRSSGNVVHELDGESAFGVWLDDVRAHAGSDVDGLDLNDDETLARLLTQYEFGIDVGGDHKIRWPGSTSTTDGPLEFAMTIPVGSVLRVMGSDREEQLESVRRAGRAAEESLALTDGSAQIAGVFVYDCVCRDAILGDEFPDAVAALHDELGVPFVGFETYGEICVQPGELSGYHNTTAVVLTIPP